MKRIGSRLLACLLAALMLWGMVPALTLAEDAQAEQPVQTETDASADAPSPTDTPKPTDTPSPTDTPKPTDTPEPAYTPEPAVTEAEEPTALPPETETAAPTETPTAEPSPTPDPTLPGESPSVSPEPTLTPEPTPAPALEGFELLLTEAGVTIARYVGGGEHAAVPAFVGDLPVTTIATGAFSDLDTLASVEVAEGVLTLESGAFNNCPLLASVALPASLNAIAEDAIIACPLAVVTAPEGSPAADYGARYAASLLAEAPVSDMMEDVLPEYNLSTLFTISVRSTQMRLHPTEEWSINLHATLTPVDGSPVGNSGDLSDWEYGKYDSDGQNVASDKMLVYFNQADGQDQIRINIGSACAVGTYTIALRGKYNNAYYVYNTTIEVLPAPTAVFDEALTIADEFGNGIPSLMYVGDATTGYSGNVQVKDGSGLDRCVFDNVYFENWNSINLNWNDGTIELNPHSSERSDTLHVRVRGYYGYNEIYYEKAFAISVAQVDFERPTLTLTNALSGNKLVVGGAEGGANTPFTLTYTVEGGDHTDDFRANVKLHAQTSYGSERLTSDGGDTYRFTEAGLYPVALVATYMNTTVSYNFYVQVLATGGAEPSATFESYFNLSKNPNGDQSSLYFVPSLAKSVWVAGFNLVKGAPFNDSDVSYQITFLGNDAAGVPYSGGVACAVVQLGSGEDWGWAHAITALPSAAEGAGPAFSRYRLTATVTREGEADQVYTTEFAVNMQAIENADNLPAKTLTLTSSLISVDYRADNQYTLALPGILLGGKTLPGDVWLDVNQIDVNGNWSNWGFLLDDEGGLKRRNVLQGTSVTSQLEWDRAEALKMRYVINYGNLRWEAPFKINIGVGENDASQLFNIESQEKTVFFGGLAENNTWGGNFWIDKIYTITGCGTQIVSAPVGSNAVINAESDNDDTRTFVSFNFTPNKSGTYRIRLWADVDEDGDAATAPTHYDHIFELKALATPATLPKAITLTGSSSMRVKVNEKFAMPAIRESTTAFNAYGWDQNLMIWGDGHLLVAGDWDSHAAAGGTPFWVDSPGRYKLVRELSIGANYYLRAFITLTVTDGADKVVLTDVSASMDCWGWDDAYTVMPKGNVENNLFMIYVNNAQLGDDVTETWSLNLSGASTGKFANIRFTDQIKGDNDRSSEARLVGFFPLQSGAVTFTVVYDAYEGTGADAVHIYHGETPEMTVRIVDTAASGDFRLVGTPVTYTADASGYVRIDAWDAVSDDIALADYTVHNDFFVANDPDGIVELTPLYDTADEGATASACAFRIDPTKTGTYLVYQHCWVSLADTDLWADTVFRVVVGSTPGTALTLYENSIDLSTVNMYDADPNITEKFYWVDAAVGETLNWKLTRKSGTSIDLAIVNSTGTWGATCTRVINSALDNTGNIVHITSMNKAGLSTFELSATLTTLSGKTLTAKKTFSVNVVELESYSATLAAPTKVFTSVVGDLTMIPQPTITWPAGAGSFTFQRNWFWSKPDKLVGYTYDESDTVRNLVLCPLEAGYYTVNFQAVRGASIADIVYTLIVNEPGESAPDAVPQMHAVNYAQKNAESYDTDGDGLIEITCPLDGGVGAWSAVAEFSMWGMELSKIEGLTFSMESPSTAGVVQAYNTKRYGDCTIISARYDKEIGFPSTYTVSALIDHIDIDKRVKITFLPPRVPQLLDGLDSLTLSAGMTYQLDVAALSAALGKPVTAFSCDYTGKTATDKRLTVSAAGLITVTGTVENAYVYAETADPATLAGIKVTVKGSPATLLADQDALTFTSVSGSQTLTLTAKDGEGNAVPPPRPSR